MAIEKTGARLLRRFILPEKNVDLALVKTKNGVLELYKNSKIYDLELDFFSKVAEKRVLQSSFDDSILGCAPQTIFRKQFNSKGENIGSSEVNQYLGGRRNIVEITASDKSVEMSGKALKIIDNKTIMGNVLDINADDVVIKFTNKKLTPMAKRILKLFNQAINK